MQVGLVVPREGLVALGGAARSWNALFEALSGTKGIEATLIDVPAAEKDTPSVLEDYARFIDLDLAGVDVVIATKYPAWMVRHPHVRVWVYHPLRGLYDLYAGTQMSPREDLPERLLGAATGGNAEALRELAAIARSNSDDELYDFPGPLVRHVVTHLDHLAFKRAERVYALSRTVAAREGYFPAGIRPRALGHPSTLVPIHGNVVHGRVFTASRLDVMKRIDMIIAAVKGSDHATELRIAGAGPDEGRLRAIAGGDPRIRFMGVLTDAELSREYAAAAVVPFVPFDEDFGLVTLEAWAHRRPVVTFSDSGGVAENVVDDVSGVVVEPSVQALTEAIDALIVDEQRGNTLGEVGLVQSQTTTWPRVLRTLLGPELDRRRSTSPRRASSSANQRGEKVVVVSTEEVAPRRHGGQLRASSLYGSLGSDVRFVSLGSSTSRPSDSPLITGGSEVVVPRSESQLRAELARVNEVGESVVDAMAEQLHHLTPDFELTLRTELEHAEIVVLSQPYLARTVLELAPSSATVVYDAQNVEADLRSNLEAGGVAARQVYDDLVDAERLAVTKSDVVVSVSAADLVGLENRYGAPKSVVVVPNGVHTSQVKWISMGERVARQLRLLERLGADADALGVFLGSMHPPNVAGALDLVEEARRRGDLPGGLHVMAAGAHAHAIDPAHLPASIHTLAMVGDARKESVLRACQLALNPVTLGSGSNLKIAEYVAAGCVVVSTPFGARGFEELAEVLVLAEPGSLIGVGAELVTDVRGCDERARAGRQLVRTHYDWDSLSGRLSAALSIG